MLGQLSLNPRAKVRLLLQYFKAKYFYLCM